MARKKVVALTHLQQVSAEALKLFPEVVQRHHGRVVVLDSKKA
jgi:hypothetical protein